MTTTTSTWGGWFRANKQCRWERLVTGSSYDETWLALLDALAPLKGGESLVTTTDPNETPPAYRRRRL